MLPSGLAASTRWSTSCCCIVNAIAGSISYTSTDECDMNTSKKQVSIITRVTCRRCIYSQSVHWSSYIDSSGTTETNIPACLRLNLATASSNFDSTTFFKTAADLCDVRSTKAPTCQENGYKITTTRERNHTSFQGFARGHSSFACVAGQTPLGSMSSGSSPEARKSRLAYWFMYNKDSTTIVGYDGELCTPAFKLWLPHLHILLVKFSKLTSDMWRNFKNPENVHQERDIYLRRLSW